MRKEIIYRYLNGECSNAETEEVLLWMQSVELESQLGEMIEQDLTEKLVENKNNQGELDHLLPKIYDSSGNEELKTPGKLEDKIVPCKETGNVLRGRRIRILKWAASVILIAIFSFIVYTVIQKKIIIGDQSELVAHQITKTNGFGRKSTIFLKDGTVVFLDSDSKITYPLVFSGGVRQVALIGEAYFDVAHDESKPFIVKAGSVNIKVLGTEFNVRAFSESDEVKVSLDGGQVEVSNEICKTGYSEKLFLSPGQSVIFNIENGNFDNVKAFNPIEDCGWKDGIIFFNKANFKTVINRLEKWYNVHIDEVNKPSSVWSYSGKFKDQNLDNVLRSIGFSQGFSYKIENEKVFIKFKNQ